MSAQSDLAISDTIKQRDLWGRLLESCVGAHLVNSSIGTPIKVFYWREGIREVDFVMQKGKMVVAVEVKSGRHRESVAGIQAFSRRHRPQRKLLIGADGIPVERFLSIPISKWLE
jgi:predicted AAA+ superfamily ATPase